MFFTAKTPLIGMLTMLYVALVCLLSVLAPNHFVQSHNNSVVIGVGDTVLDIHGYSAPFAQVYISENNSVLASTNSDASGYFNTILTAQTPGLRNLQIYATTTSLVQTDPINTNINVTEHFTTELNVFLPTTVDEFAQSYQNTEKLNLSGQARPNMFVIVTINGAQTHQTSTSNLGYWYLSVDLVGIAVGSHYFDILVHDGIGGQSNRTQTREFHIVAPVLTPQPTTSTINLLQLTPLISIAILGPLTISAPGSIITTDKLIVSSNLQFTLVNIGYWVLVGLVIALSLVALRVIKRR